MQYRNWLVLILTFLGSVLLSTVGHASEQILFRCEFPYYLGIERSAVVPGENIQALVVVENRGPDEQIVPVKIEAPYYFVPATQHEGWQVLHSAEKTILSTSVNLDGGYGQWFDLLRFTVSVDAMPGLYHGRITVNGQQQEFGITVAQEGRMAAAPVAIAGIVLPLDKDGRKDERLDSNTLVLRDRKLDYYKNVLTGKGAANLEIEAVHPVTHMAVEFANPGRQQKLITVSARLLDETTHQPLDGLFTPGTTGEDKDGGAMGGSRDRLEVFAALTGEATQRILMPVYADEQYVAGGRYLLQVVADDGLAQPLVMEIPLTIVKKNLQAMTVTLTAVLVLLAFLTMGLYRLRSVVAQLKTRWLITIALFGAAAFAVVNVPSTLLSDFFHVLLGPFGFLVTGLFTSLFLYMLIVSLVILIPHPGVVSLLTAVRMLLGMLVFGNLSPAGLLSYGVHAFLLEALFYLTGFYAKCAMKEKPAGFSFRQMLNVAMICAVADGLASYVAIQSMAFLYRMYYAEWYIYTVMVVNGLVYTSIGAVCGMVLGRRLVRVGGD